MEQTNNNEKSVGIGDIFGFFRKNWILILVIVILFSAMGVVYGRFQKPVYTARHQAFYSTRNITVDDPNAAEHVNVARAFMDTVVDFADEELVVKRADYLYDEYLSQKLVNPDLTAKEYLNSLDEVYKKYDYSELSELVQAPVDVFFKQEVLEGKQLIDRTFVFRGTLTSRSNDKITVMSNSETAIDISKSDFLYAVKTDRYMSEYSFADLSLLSAGDNVKVYMSNVDLTEELVCKFVSVDNNVLTLDVNGTEVEIKKANFKKLTLTIPSYFNADSISVDYANGTNDTDESFVFTFKYTDDTPELAIDKVQFVIKAMSIETNIYLFNENAPMLAKFVLFKNVEVNIDGSAGYLYYTSSVSKTKTRILFFVIGVAAGCLIAYIKEILDKTIKKKEDLEAISGTKILTVIPAEEDE